MPARAEHGVAEEPRGGGVEPAGGIDAGDAGVCDALRDEQAREEHAGDEVVGDPLATVLAEPRERWDRTANAVGGVVHVATNHSRPARVKGVEPDGMRGEGPGPARALEQPATA